MRNEPIASIVQEALEGFASGRLDSQAEVKHFLESKPEFPKCLPNGEIRNQRVTELLKRPVYAGYVESEKWHMSLRKGQHEGLISFETHQKIQKRLKEGAYVPARKDISDDFPLRGFVLCGDCDSPMTSCWSKSSTGKKHPYYMCYQKECVSYRKSIRRDQIEGDFEGLLSSMQPTKEIITFAKGMFRDIWDVLTAQGQTDKKTLKKQLRQTEHEISQFLDRIVETNTASVITTYERRIANLEAEKLLVEEKLSKNDKPRASFEKSFELALAFLSNPYKLWRSGKLDIQRTVLKMAFSERPAYIRNSGFRTPQVSEPFRFLENFKLNMTLLRHS